MQVRETVAEAAQAGLTRDAALQWALDQLPRIDALAPHWVEELRGLAEGATISLAEAIALQVRPGAGRMPHGCTSFAVAADATADGKPLSGQNRDLESDAYLQRMFVARIHQADGPAILMHNVPGELGGTGLNSHGVCVWANSMWSKTNRRAWMGAPVIRRALLECTDADEAVDRLRALRPACGNLLVADAASRIRNVELMPERMAVIARDTGVYAHANNVTSPDLLRYELQPLPSPGSDGRRCRLAAGLEAEAGRITVDTCRRWLSNETPDSESICRRAGPDDPVLTVTGLIAEPASGTLHLSYGPPSDGYFSTHTLGD